MVENVILPICGWKMKKEDIRDELSNSGVLKIAYFVVFDVLVKFVAPAGILIVFAYNLGFINF